MKILHITNWYPNQFNKYEAKWIKEHIDALSVKTENRVIHFELFKHERFRVIKNKTKYLSQYLIQIPFEKWFIYEVIHFSFLVYILLIKRKSKEFDVINFHIAYPMLTYWHWIKRFIKKPIVITEHWSAYHYNFGVNKNLPRIKKIFSQKLPVITVSKALANDIKQFANSDFPSFLIPNVVDENIFYPGNNTKENFYFMVSQWKSPKTPLLAMKAFINSSYVNDHQLIIGGYGSLWNEMKQYVSSNNLESKIKFVEKLNSSQIANYMRKCKAFLHPTDYETFSVVCAEAIACGAFVVAPNSGGIPEVIKSNGFLLSKNTLDAWEKAFELASFKFNSISVNQFSAKTIGDKYSKVLESLVRNKIND
ncbi:glycoside hydrolase [Marivirga tractuosa]|uniref:Glycosyl transferase group 1 n=1 Tax=Marivirga tractuosa (strain ATCC 23168 / DSM 4126 / NBRC 15989 / NCIMB 1408 / VKM B-1430 / H-43) TaxID=643867 RepID=E4TVV4_MARTH|nr:glycosyltransferase [Marivirga tractuosa]ADR22202.1 glycosyl transferase group 1 [Marivirga tractuosa DSM 4126]BDD13332.1 glycoside hydrolase [Marivirga tractuosa]